MNIREITNKNEWKDSPEFLQSWEYGEFLKTVGRNIKRIQIGEGDSATQIQYILTTLPLGISYVYIPWADISKSELEHVLHYFKTQKISFVRAELLKKTNTQKYKIKPFENIQVRNTWRLDIKKTKDELLTAMHSKTRYNIRLADRKGVTVDNKKDLDLFWDLNMTTTERNRYQSHPKSYCKKLLELPNTYQINAYFEEKPVACVILFKHRNNLYYFIGASANEYRNLMAPYLLQWKAIQLGKELGCEIYDFWGMAPPSKQGSGKESCYHNYCWEADHNLTGVARFKAGFNGELKSYPDAQEIILHSPKYTLFKLIQKLRKGRAKAGHPLS
ncbi:hypothetical protein C0581_02040 [Candidatus Parcubacteria bacterium]|nr:MAG: hypothetical protein C0581_02040 [Candidatus Parcubacteria bacterium]